MNGIRFVLSAIAHSPIWMRLTLFLALVGVIGLVTVTVLINQGKVVPGVVVIGVPVGGLSYEDAATAIRANAGDFDNRQVTISYGKHTWQPRLRDLGISVDVEAAITQAPHAGQGSGMFDGFLRILQLRSGPVLMEPPMEIDRAKLEAYCVELMEELEMAPVNSNLQVSGETVLVTPDGAGYVVNADRLQQDLVRQLRGFTWPTIDLDVRLAPATLRSSDLQYGLSQISTALSQPLTLYTADEQWTIAPIELARHVKLDDSGGSPAVVIDEAAITAIVGQIADDLDQPVQGAEVSESGPYPRILSQKEGRTVDREQLEVRIYQAITTGTHEMEIPVEVTPATGNVTELLAEYGVTDLIASVTSDFTGSSAGRAANVRRAAELIDGTLIPPGEIFSFNEATGLITEENGFVPAGLAESGIPGDAAGGGICQVSTSIFRAALLAGLAITEWWSHPYRSAFYEQGGWAPGFDAMVQPGELDFRFVNTTNRWIMIQISVAADEVTVSVVGTDPGFAVEVADPWYDAVVAADDVAIEEVDFSLPSGSSVLWQPARDGVTMIIQRTVWAADGTLISDEDFISTYWPQGPVYRVSPDMVSGGDSG